MEATKFKVELTPNNTGTPVDFYTLKPGVAEEILHFLTFQPYKEVKEYVTLVESQTKFSDEEIVKLVQFLAKFPIYSAISAFSALTTEGNVIPNYKVDESTVEVQE